MLQDLVTSYNNSYHRTLETTPTLAEKNPLKVRIVNENRYIKLKSKIKSQNRSVYPVGTQVRVLLDKTKFSRGYKQTFSDEIFKIKTVDTHLPIHLYVLEDFSNNELSGKFYANEITPISSEA